MLLLERRLDKIYTTVFASSVEGVYSEVERQTFYGLFCQVVRPIVTL